ncbi:MAG: PD40 domain-containing protein, partial [Gemmatimonadetes bacterium]|nr:PD40 domain-containing protein [Gemmatimonadota bacterium]
PGIELMPAISPDGQEVAYVAEASASEPSRVLVQSLSGGQPTRVSDEGADGEAYPQWTADGASLSFHAGGVAYQVGARGGTPRPIMQVESGTRTYGAWSPDGTRFAYVGGGSGETGMYVRENEVETKIADIGGTANSLAWSPDGRWIAYAEGNADWTRLGFFFGNVSPSAVMVVAADGGTPVEVAPSQYLNVAPAFLPDGRLLFVSARGGVRDVYLVELTPDGAPAGEPRRITAGLNPHSISVSADGRRLAFGTLNRRRNLYSVEIPTSGVVSAYSGTPVVDGPQVIEGMAVSPDGQWLAFDSDRGGTQTAYRRRLSGGEALQLTTSLSDEFVRSWSPDGSFIAGHGFNEGVRDIWVSDPDGLSFRFVLSSPYQDRYPDISPDGRRIAFGSERDDDGTSTLFVSEVDSQGQWGPPTPIGKGAQPRWSPDGTTIASSFQGEVFLTSPEGGESRIVPVDNAGGFVAGVEWVTDQELVVMLLFSDRTAGIWSLSRADGSLRERVRFDDPARTPRSEMAVHDGKVYYTFGEFEADIWLMEMTWR